MTKRKMAGTSESGIGLPVLYDRYLLCAVIILIMMGLLMVTSASIVISNRVYGQSFHFLWRQLICLAMGLVSAGCIFRTQIAYWQKWGGAILLLTVIFLVIVLIPGVGREVNGSMRWIGYHSFGLQVSEFAKLSIIIYLAGYLVRRLQEVRSSFKGFLKPLFILGILSILLLKEPDFGATVVILMTAMGMLFLSGVKIYQFALLLLLAAVTLASLAVSSPYRLERLTTFLNPWASQFDSGYQLIQSLIAFGRGGWFGVGLGASIQKLFYLPEAHTDFLFAVVAEEWGLVGALVMMGLFALVVVRGMKIGYLAEKYDKPFAAYLAYGLTLWIGLQAMINIGVNIGVFPTKGLTLPLVSYGGSSLLASCMAVALLLRIDYETRLSVFGLTPPSANSLRRKTLC
jgi:cell division protein FtsW